MALSAPPPSWASIKNKPTTVSGFGISDMAAQTVANATNEKCKAWVNFNGTGTVAIRRAFNVSSITDNGTGNYTLNFYSDLGNTNYAAFGQTRRTPFDTGASARSVQFPNITSGSNLNLRVGSTDAAFGATDEDEIFVCVMS